MIRADLGAAAAGDSEDVMQARPFSDSFDPSEPSPIPWRTQSRPPAALLGQQEDAASHGMIPMRSPVDPSAPVGSAASTSFAAVGGASVAPIPSGAEAEIAFISGVTSGAKIAATSFWTWNGNKPATYSSTSDANKWGSTTLSTSGTSGGTVYYWFDATSNWTTTEKAALVSGLDLWSAECNITFAQAASAGAASFTFKRGSDGSAYETNPSLTSTTVGSGTAGSPGSGVYISIDTSVAGFGPIGSSFDTYGGYTYQTLVHEIGHLIGLGHGGAYNGNVTSSTQQYSAYDTRLWSIMSYIDPTDTSAKYYNSYPVSGANWGWNSSGYYYEPTTPMALDIIAAQRLYGRPTSGPLVSGGQVFGFNCNITGSIKPYFDFTTNAHPVITLWDGGTGNTLDLSGYTSASTINLTPGTFTSCNGMVDNICIATDTVIETAIGGSGNDTITGSSYNNVFRGGGGTDTINGGAGWDKTIFNVASGSASLTHNANGSWTIAASGQTETLTNVEVVQFTDKTMALRERPKNDFDGNNCSDILWRNTSSGHVIQNLMSGSQLLSSAYAADGDLWSVVGTGDFNGDGSCDILWQHAPTGAVIENLMNGSQILSSTYAADGNVWLVVGTGDFNGDGNYDVLWRYSPTGAIVENLMNGSQLLSSTYAADGDTWAVVGTGDFNGDGNSDILWRHRQTGAVVENLMNGSQLISSAYAADGNVWSVAGTGDFNGDGSCDILWRYAPTGAVIENLMSGAKILSSTYAADGNAWSVVGTGDYNGDSKCDIMWRYVSSGAIIQNLMNGTQLLSSTYAADGTQWSPASA
ncbi:M10 family metallopeptidase C-terminal domain-containing protein [Rhodoplanes roseus]|nr:M10 family metallopeptidase C-terminal domain-containing protein [Rhodoplanes roseus]